MDEVGEPSRVDGLRSQAIDAARAHRWADLLELQPKLERDTEYWTSVWGPICAVAAHHLDRADARGLLDSVIEAGFHDVNPVADLFADSFATEPDWPALRARIEANKPPPPIEVTTWPCAAPVHPLGLGRLDAEGETVLARRLPTPAGTAQDTALAVLAWVTSRWRHSSANHAPGWDANEVLDLVQAGQRFACREFTIVLTQALNTIGIPARPLALYRDDYYTGIGTGHAVTEAWLDDLERWVVLDGQNGATWRGSDGTPLGVVELQQMSRQDERPAFVGSGPNFDPTAAEEWRAYFRHCSTGGAAWRPSTFVPVVEGRTVLEARPLVNDAAAVHPDLSEISTSVVDYAGVPAVLFGTEHPYAVGFSVVDEAGAGRSIALDEPVPLDGVPGEHAWQVATLTRYASLRPWPLAYTLR